MNLTPSWCEVFRSEGWTATHWSTVGSPTATDTTLVAWAIQHNHLVLTHDLDFSAILAASRDRVPSVVQLRAQDVSPEAHGATLVRLIREHRQELQEGALLTYDTQRSRLRLLPLR